MTPLTLGAVTALAQTAATSPAHLDPQVVQQVCQEWQEQRTQRDGAWETLNQARHTHAKELADAQAEALAMRRERDEEITERVLAERSHDGAWAEANAENDRHIQRITELESALTAAQQQIASLTDDRDAARAERDALMVRVDQWRQMADREVTASVEMRAERDAALAERDEARRVLGRIEWVRIGGKMQPYCPFCWEQAKDGHTADCALAAVLAQEEEA